MKRALFRTDASAAIGGGHVMRCLTLAGELQSRGWHCIFSCSPETSQTIPALLTSGHEIRGTDEAVDPVDVLIVDHYGLDARYEEKCRLWAKRIVVIDDLADRPHDCDLLIDQTFGRSPDDYKALVPAHCEVLTGSDYALLRPQFAAARPAALARRQKQAGKIERILVMMGAGDKDNMTGLALSGLELLEETLAIDVIMGASAPHLQTIRQQSQESRHNVTVHIDVSDVASLMAEADLCIGAGGTTSWERCCMGLPSLLIILADNQKVVAQNLHEAGALQVIGWMDEIDPPTLAQAIENYQKEPAQLEAMAEKSADICDGRGIKRLTPRLYPAVKTKNGAEIRVRCMEISDADIILDWQSFPGTRRYSRNPDTPGKSEHFEWIRRNINDINCESYIIELDRAPAGLLRLDRRDNETYEVSILTAPQYYKQGVAAAALNIARLLRLNAILMAEILEENKASRSLFMKLGYQPIGNNTYIHKDAPYKN